MIGYFPQKEASLNNRRFKWTKILSISSFVAKKNGRRFLHRQHYVCRHYYRGIHLCLSNDPSSFPASLKSNKNWCLLCFAYLWINSCTMNISSCQAISTVTFFPAHRYDSKYLHYGRFLCLNLKCRRCKNHRVTLSHVSRDTKLSQGLMIDYDFANATKTIIRAAMQYLV